MNANNKLKCPFYTSPALFSTAKCRLLFSQVEHVAIFSVCAASVQKN